MKKLTSAILSAILLTGCSSVVSKSEYAVAINSNPDGARFEIANRAGQKVHSGTTPSTVTLRSSAGYFKGESYTVVLNKDGFAPRSYALASSVDGWYFGNILLGGLIGMLIVDPATGAMYNLPERMDVSLEPTTASTEVTKDKLKIATIDSLTPEQIARLEKL